MSCMGTFLEELDLCVVPFYELCVAVSSPSETQRNVVEISFVYI